MLRPPGSRAEVSGPAANDEMEMTPFLAESVDADPDPQDLVSARAEGPSAGDPIATTRPVLRRLYVSHLLSTFNSRLFEFGAVLFLASIYPGTLAPLSAYALIRGLAAISLSGVIGHWIDHGNRLHVVRTSILVGRIAVVSSCVAFWAMTRYRGMIQTALFVGVIVMACAEKLASVLNLLAVERDWVVVITEGDDGLRQTVNSEMRRLDLFCKLLGPLAISLIDSSSTTAAILVTAALNLASVSVEYLYIAQVYHKSPSLQSKGMPIDVPNDQESAHGTPTNGAVFSGLSRLIPVFSTPFYFKSPAFLPSFSLAVTYLTVLSFSGQMVTFLISSGFTSRDVGILRSLATVFELMATWVAPWLMRYMGTIRAGIWSLSWQMGWLGAGVLWFYNDWSKRDNPLMPVIGLVAGITLSRVGLWSFDLCAQTIVQDEVDVSHRGEFSSVEASFQNLFELLSYCTTIVFSRPDQFQWPILMSVVAVYLAGVLYASFVRHRRGHLFHAPPCLCEKT